MVFPGDLREPGPRHAIYRNAYLVETDRPHFNEQNSIGYIKRKRRRIFKVSKNAAADFQTIRL